MKALSPAAARVATRRNADPTYLVRLEFTAPTPLTLYLSDAPRVALGQRWLPMIAAWDALTDTLNVLDAGGAPATTSIRVYNSKPVAGRARFSDLMRTPGNPSGYQFA